MAGKAKNLKDVFNEIDPSGEAWERFHKRRAFLGEIEKLGPKTAADQAQAETLAWLKAGKPKEPAAVAVGGGVPLPAAGEELLRDADEFAETRVGSRAIVEWVAANLAIKEPDEKTAPNSTAWGLWKWASSSSSNEATFWSSMWAKLLPNRSANDTGDLDDDDDGELVDALEFVYDAKRAALLRAGSEGTFREPGFPGRDSSAVPGEPGEPAAIPADVRG